MTVHLQMDAHMEPDVEAGNVMGDIVGSEHPEQVVVIGGHIDSWDVGQGAQDDGSGIMAAYEAVQLIHKLGLKPKRTIRLVFWVNEENGAAGGKAYRKLMGDKIGDTVAAIEMDEGAERPLGMGYDGVAAMKAGAPLDIDTLEAGERASFAALQDIVSLLGPIGANSVLRGGGGSDIAPLVADGLNQPPVARIDAQRHLQLHLAQAPDIGQGGPQVNICADVGEGDQGDYGHDDHANARDEN